MLLLDTSVFYLDFLILSYEFFIFLLQFLNQNVYLISFWLEKHDFIIFLHWKT